MADQADPSTSVASTSNDIVEAAPTADDVKPVETGMTEAEEKKEVDAVTPDKEVEEPTNTNGHTENEAAATEVGKESVGDEDAKMEDTGSASAAAPRTPAATKKAASGSSKKKGGVPEHKSKKLNKKKSKPTLRLNVHAGELYLARMKGHPPWPSIICDEEMLPESLTTTRPVTTALPDGTFKKPEYADGGKRAYERTYPIMFLRTNEFAWIPNTELTPLAPRDCKNVSEKGKQKALKEAYDIASQNHDLAYFKDMLGEHAKAMEEDEQLRADKEAEKEAKKARQAKRKSTATVADDEDADEMDVDDEGEPKPKASKKRKKSLESDGEEKPAKAPKTAIKLKMTTPKTPSEPSKKAAKAKGSRKSAAKVEEDEVEDVAVPEEKPLTPAEAKDKKEKEIKYYRHKLQKGFLSRDLPPDDEETKSMSSFLNKLENHQDLEGSIIRATKIHKVLKAMIRLSSIPLDETYNFKARCIALLALWNKTLSDDPATAAEANEGAEGIEQPKTNGVSGEDHATENGEKADELDAEAAAAPEVKESTLEGKIGTDVEGAKEAEDDAEKDTTAENTKETDVPDVDDKPEDAYVPPAEPVEASA